MTVYYNLNQYNAAVARGECNIRFEKPGRTTPVARFNRQVVRQLTAESAAAWKLFNQHQSELNNWRTAH